MKTQSKIAIITGGNSGIGLAAAHEMAAQGATVCLACRDMAKAARARDGILKAHPGAQVELFEIDLASFDKIRRFVAAFQARHPALDVLVNNAGAAPLRKQFTAEGFELQFGANYLGPFLLTHLLMPLLRQAAAEGRQPRIVHLASIAHFIGRIDERTFRGQRPYRPLSAYAQSKLGNLMFSHALSRRLPPGITSQALHPGAIASNVWRDLPRPVYALIRPTLVTPERAGKMVADMALAPAYAGRNGTYESLQWPRPHSRTARDVEQQERLYHLSCNLAGVQPLPVLEVQAQAA